MRSQDEEAGNNQAFSDETNLEIIHPDHGLCGRVAINVSGIIEL